MNWEEAKKEFDFMISPGLWRKSHKIMAAIIVTMLLLYVGFIIGSYVTIKSVADVASRFIDPELVERAVWQYQNQMNNCFPPLMEDALAYSD